MVAFIVIRNLAFQITTLSLNADLLFGDRTTTHLTFALFILPFLRLDSK